MLVLLVKYEWTVRENAMELRSLGPMWVLRFRHFRGQIQTLTFLQGGGHLNMEQEARMGSGVPLPTGNCVEP